MNFGCHEPDMCEMSCDGLTRLFEDYTAEVMSES